MEINNFSIEDLKKALLDLAPHELSSDRQFVLRTGTEGMRLYNKEMEIAPWLQRLDRVYGDVWINPSYQRIRDDLRVRDKDKVNIAKVAVELKERGWH